MGCDRSTDDFGQQEEVRCQIPTGGGRETDRSRPKQKQSKRGGHKFPKRRSHTDGYVPGVFVDRRFCLEV